MMSSDSTIVSNLFHICKHILYCFVLLIILEEGKNAFNYIELLITKPFSAIYILHFIVPSAAKYPLPLKVVDFEKNFFALFRLMLCYPRLPQMKYLPSIIGCEPIRSFNELFSKNQPPLDLIHTVRSHASSRSRSNIV